MVSSNNADQEGNCSLCNVAIHVQLCSVTNHLLNVMNCINVAGKKPKDKLSRSHKKMIKNCN